jgi:7,8-dihydropterin-6-yl-methyl-4-(beta-D-ribofuranosyl)aminobenzene 5'-phosphate synthase
MRRTQLFGVIAAIGSAWILSSYAASPKSAAAEAARITILYDAFGKEVPGITVIAQVSDAPGTKELKELSLAVNTADGVVLVVACAHPGIESIVAEAAKINPHIHFIAGGFHLVDRRSCV